ncbi:hypothetical protein WJX81_005236 [Elliptochloris bilobata]|uniref:UBA domain-containing protein n=1 Tax=Elliptochloris bilobata TaxID=381761 RepID=A0AAW1RED5_9CHLO
MQAGPHGFGGAPVTKALVLVTASTSVLLQASRGLHRRLPAYVDLFVRLFTFRHVGELLAGCALLYHSRLFERQSGSSKYGAFVALSLGLPLAISLVTRLPLPSGPFSLIAANLVNFMLDVPPTARFLVFGWSLTDKAFVYMAGLQLLLSAPRQALLGAVAGAAVGAAQRCNLLGLRDLRVPAPLASALGRVLGPLLQGAQRPPPHALTAQAESAGDRRSGGSTAGPPAASAPPLPAPDEGALAQLEAMGFDRARAATALQQCGSVQDALDALCA